MRAGFASRDSKSSARASVGPYGEQYELNGNGMSNRNGNGHGAMESHVESKYDGTAADQRDMQDMGRVQELRVRLAC